MTGPSRIKYTIYCSNVEPYVPKIQFVTSEVFEVRIGDLFHRQFGDRIVSIEYRNKELMFDIPIKSSEQGSRTALEAFDAKVLELLSGYYEGYKLKRPLKLYDQFVGINVNDNTNGITNGIRVEHNNVSIYIEGNTSLKDIHKFISCKDLRLVMHRKSKITGNVLGILKIEGLTNIHNINGMNDIAGWYDIIKTYVKAGRHDIISCQEELLDKGFGEYAKL